MRRSHSADRSIRTFGVVPIGTGINDLLPGVQVALQVALGQSFAARVVDAAALPLPHEALDHSRGQYRASKLLDQLAVHRDPAWERTLGVANVDLYAPGLNFAFGEADPRRGVALFSLFRLRQAGAASGTKQLDRRCAVEAVHEVGHTYGLGHCTDPACVMWFSNTLAETDTKGTAFCRRHMAELELHLGGLLAARDGQ